MFSGLGLIDEALDAPYPAEHLITLIELRQVWVACQTNDVPVGMAIASVRERAAYFEEMDVLPRTAGEG